MPRVLYEDDDRYYDQDKHITVLVLG